MRTLHRSYSICNVDADCEQKRPNGYRQVGTPLANNFTVVPNNQIRKELLVIDDHWPTARSYARVLAPLGTVVVVGSVEDAIRWVDGEHQLAAIVCEIGMPNDGAAQLKQHLSSRRQDLLPRLVMVSREGLEQVSDTEVFSTSGRNASALLRRVQVLSVSAAQ